MSDNVYLQSSGIYLQNASFCASCFTEGQRLHLESTITYWKTYIREFRKNKLKTLCRKI